MKIILVFLVMFLVNLANASRCDIYLQLDAQLVCSESETNRTPYLREYGYYYCERFNKVADRLHPENPKTLFIRGTTLCLQEFLVSQFYTNALTCKNLDSLAVRSHYQCYLENGFCDLSLKDQMAIGQQCGLFCGI